MSGNLRNYTPQQTKGKIMHCPAQNNTPITMKQCWNSRVLELCTDSECRRKILHRRKLLEQKNNDESWDKINQVYEMKPNMGRVDAQAKQ